MAKVNDKKVIKPARPPAAVSRWMRQINAMRVTRGGPPRAAERCPCGQNSLKRARSRSFDCCKKKGVDIQR